MAQKSVDINDNRRAVVIEATASAIFFILSYRRGRSHASGDRHRFYDCDWQ